MLHARIALGAISVCLLTASRGLAQGVVVQPSTVIVTGKVVDPSGVVIPNAKVTLTGTSQSFTKQVLAGADGSFRIEAVPVGTANLRFEAPGFSVVQLSNENISQENANLPDVKLSLGSCNTSVDVTVGESSDPCETLSQSGTHKKKTDPTPTPYVQVKSVAVGGPLGYVDAPTITGATQSLNSMQQAIIAAQKFNYPSIIVYISAVPLVTVVPPDDKKDTDKIKSAQETDRNPLWLDASFSFIPVDNKNVDHPEWCGNDKVVQVIGLLPQATVASSKDRVVTDAASSINDVAGALASFYPGVSTQVSAATSALNVLFKDIFPPQPVAFQYSNIRDSCHVGWFFRPNKSTATGATGPASILGMQTGIVLMKTSTDVASIKVKGLSVSAWSKRPTSYSKKLFVQDEAVIGTVAIPSRDNVDLSQVTNVAIFPALISQADAMRILNFTDATKFKTFAATNLVGTDSDFSWVTNASVNSFLTSATPSKPAGGAVPAVTPASSSGPQPTATNH